MITNYKILTLGETNAVEDDYVRTGHHIYSVFMLVGWIATHCCT